VLVGLPGVVPMVVGSLIGLRVVVAVRMGVGMATSARPAAIHDLEVRRRDARAHDRRDAQVVLDAQAAERLAEAFDGETCIEKRAEQHVARRARKAVQVHHTRHQKSPASFIEQ
jgi:hypothetical protein